MVRGDPTAWPNDEVATEAEEAVLKIKSSPRNKTAFTGEHVGCGAILGLAIIWLVQQVSPAKQL